MALAGALPRNRRIAQEAMDVLDAQLTRQLAVNLQSCVHCGRCFESCHYFLSIGDPKLTPAYKAEQLRKLFKAKYDWMGRLFPAWVRAVRADEEQLERLYDAAFGSCTMCRRCNFNCPMGLDMGLMMRAARTMLTSVGLIPSGLKATVDAHLITGNTMGVTAEDFVETVEWIEEELRKDVDDPNLKIPIDKPGTRYMLCLNPREVKFFPLLLMALLKTSYAAGEDWGVSSAAWDATNYGLFSGDDSACSTIVTRLIDEAARLGAEALVVSECAHAYRSYRWEAPRWYGKPLPVDVISYVELTARYIEEGRLTLDPSKNTEPVTYHDPCNQARSGGIVHEPRTILQHAVTDFREMVPNGIENFCCGGGGGALTMTEFRARRLAAARVKAEQIKATGAKIVATSCHNCIDQLVEVNRHYKLGVQVVNLCELVANAIVLPSRAVPEWGMIAGKPVEVDERGFMANPAQWDRGAAQYLALRQGYGQSLAEITDEHWRVVDYIRSFHERTNVAPRRGDICLDLGLTNRQLHKLFPGTLRTALRVSGLPASSWHEDAADQECATCEPTGRCE